MVDTRVAAIFQKKQTYYPSREHRHRGRRWGVLYATSQDIKMVMSEIRRAQKNQMSGS